VKREGCSHPCFGRKQAARSRVALHGTTWPRALADGEAALLAVIPRAPATIRSSTCRRRPAGAIASWRCSSSAA
jgi:hypothetical protein